MATPLHIILVIEDCEEDFVALLRAFRKSGIDSPVLRCGSGDEALDYLFRRNDYADIPAPRPGVMLLDLNLPGTDGREVLARIKADDDLKTIPVVVLSSSARMSNVAYSYETGAASYLVKPGRFAELQKMVTSFVDYWSGVESIPALGD